MNELFGTNHFIKFKLTAKSNSYASAFWIMIRLCICNNTKKRRHHRVNISLLLQCEITVTDMFPKNLPTRIQLGCGRIILDDDHIIFYNTRRFVYVSLDIRVIHSLNSHILQRLRHDLFMQKKWNMLTFYMQTRRVHNEKPGSNVMYTTVWIITKTFHREHSWKHLLNSL
jgi:hypothetical protein